MNRLTQAEVKISPKLSEGVRKCLPQIEELQDSLIIKFEDDDEKPLWKVPGQLEQAELLMDYIEEHLDKEIVNEIADKDRCIFM